MGKSLLHVWSVPRELQGVFDDLDVEEKREVSLHIQLLIAIFVAKYEFTRTLYNQPLAMAFM
jgi:hypothetical protein